MGVRRTSPDLERTRSLFCGTKMGDGRADCVFDCCADGIALGANFSASLRAGYVSPKSYQRSVPLFFTRRLRFRVFFTTGFDWFPAIAYSGIAIDSKCQSLEFVFSSYFRFVHNYGFFLRFFALFLCLLFFFRFSSQPPSPPLRSRRISHLGIGVELSLCSLVQLASFGASDALTADADLFFRIFFIDANVFCMYV